MRRECIKKKKITKVKDCSFQVRMLSELRPKNGQLNLVL